MMKWEELHKDMVLSPAGMGIVFYSEGAMKDVPIGEDFLKKEFWQPHKVAEHIKKGDVVGICTGCDAADFELRFRSGYPDDEIKEKYPAYVQLGIEVMGNAINVIDLYWLMDWSDQCPAEQQIEIEPGFYHMTFCAEPPVGAMEKILSDEEFDAYMDKARIIYVFLNRLDALPECDCEGVPDIYGAYDNI